MLTEADGWGEKGEDGDSRLLIFPSLLGRGVWDFGSVVQGSANRSHHRVTKRMNEYTEPARLELVLCNKRGHDSERPTHRDEEWPPLAATRERPRTETKTQHSQK